MSDHPRRRRLVLWLLAGTALGALAAVGLYRWHHAAADPFPVPPYSKSSYLNTGPEVRYVGSGVCAECHHANYQSYLLTPHSRALSDIDPAAEPPDGTFEHRLSGRSYRVYRANGQMRHEEVLRTAEGKEIGRIDLPIRYLVGSGNFCRTYLVETDGFLHESPITWYAAKKKWDLSPGYDFAQHWGFERPVLTGCLVCHAGRLEPADGTLHRITFHEKAIGCENCHGPGAPHEDLRRAGKHAAGQDDRTIVNPGKLTRPQLESVCGVCHLNGPASVWLRGRQATDYRPGLPLTDFRIDYQFDSGGEQMTVVGHIEQLRRSACYLKSDELTCLTCHDPHAREKPKDSVAFYRQKCLGCHTVQSCRLDHAERLKKEKRDDCVACHMPRGDTDIPHVAFTHHRIGRHTAAPAPPLGLTVPELVPTDDVAHVPPLDQKRSLGLAYLAAHRNPVYAEYAEVFRERARGLLEAVRAAGMRDAETSAALAEIYFPTDHNRARLYAQEALDGKGASAEVRVSALLMLGSCELQDGNYQAASGTLEQLVGLRLFAEDWRLLGISYAEQKDPDRALTALRKALTIKPFRPTVHSALATVYQFKGDGARAKEHLEKAQWLSLHQQD